MPVNHHFQGGNGIGNSAEKRLHEDLIIEGLRMYGLDNFYLPRTLVNKDLVLGEDTLSKFGLEIREDTTFVIAKRRWQNQVDNKATMIVAGRPNEGDLIYVPLMNSFFEIQFVEDQEPFFQLGNLPVFKMRCTRFEYSSEKIDTGRSEIDIAEDRLSTDQLQHQLTLEDGGGIMLEDSDTTINTINFLLAETHVDINLATQTRDYADNATYNADAGFDTASTGDDILDFTERNPFGEVDET